MGWIYHDTDEWETVTEVTKDSVSYGLKKRAPEEIEKLKAEKQRLYENAVIDEALEILKRRVEE